jgi:DNA-binding MarR family transcriptional regulator
VATKQTTAHTANLLGALALVVHDRFSEAMSDVLGESESAAAALSSLDNLVDRPTIDLLRRVLGLTSSGTVRLVDRLEDEGYLERVAGADRRATAVRLTRAGRRAARGVAAARGDVLGGALSTLSADERSQFDALLSRLLVGMMRGPGAERFMCRLCDTRACGHAEGRCPVRTAAARAYSSPGSSSARVR